MKLLILQSMWAMENILPGGDTLPLPEAVRRIAEHGFAGVTDHFTDRRHVRRLTQELRPLGLTAEAQCFPKSVDELQPTLELAAEFGCHHVTIQPDVRTRDKQAALALLRGWQRLAEQVDFPVLVETHRYRLTNDLFFTLELLEELPSLRLVGDLSHYVAGHELPLVEGDPQAEAQLKAIMRHCHAYHGRVSNCEQVQLPISFAQHQPWLEQYRRLWRWGFANWCERAAPGDSLAFTCELGTRPYAITGADGQDITDRWAESLQLKQLAETIWAEVAPQA